MRPNEYKDATSLGSRERVVDVDSIRLTKPSKQERRAARRAGNADRAKRRQAQLSVLYLLIRTRLKMVILLLGGLIGVELFLFGRAVAHANLHDRTGWSKPNSLSWVWQDACLVWIFLVAFIALTVLLVTAYPRGREHSELTLLRLSVGESSLFLWQAVFAAGCYLLLCTTQVLVAFGTGVWYVGEVAKSMQVAQSLGFVTVQFYNHILLHSLLPLSDLTRWLASTLILAAMSLTVARAGRRRIYRRRSAMTVLVAIGAILLFPRLLGTWDWDIIVVTPIMLLCILITLLSLRKEVMRDDS